MDRTVSNQANNLDLLRLVLAALVIYTHSYSTYYGNENNPEPLYQFSNNRITFGSVAVNFFFIISGYLVIQSWINSRNAFEYLKKRVLRIYPAFVFVCILCAFLFVPLGNNQYSSSLSNYFLYLRQVDFNYQPQTIIRLAPPNLPPTFLHLPIPFELNFSIWTIPYEFYCYLLLLGMGIFKMAKNKWWMLAFTLVSFANLAYFQYGSTKWISAYLRPESFSDIKSMSYFLPFFMAGISFYHFEKYMPKKNPAAIISFLITALSFRFTNAYLFFQLILGSYFIFCFAFSKQINLSRLTRHGDFSYGVYLYGWPVQQLVMFNWGKTLNFYGTLVASLLIVIVFAIFSWFVVEKPFLKLKNLNFFPRNNFLTGQTN
jgi:peptidoglycan/LPS O-acetylase OafA/YrhL